MDLMNIIHIFAKILIGWLVLAVGCGIAWIIILTIDRKKYKGEE